MKKLLIFLISTLSFLSACVESGNSDDITNIDSVDISGIGSTSDINKSGTFNLEISGIRNIITVKSNNVINNLDVSGISNKLYIEQNTSIKTFVVSGTSNIIYVPVNSGITFNDTGTSNELKTRSTNSILGNWTLTYPDTQCIESYIFNSDLTFSGTSLDEVFSGVYTFEKTVVTGVRHLLTVTITADNSLTDCLGASTSETGKTANVYINFLNTNTSEWYTSLTGGTAHILITK